MIKERMTPEELARLTGYSRQTINKWVRKEGWSTSPKPGVQGGKARLVHVNEKVREFIRNARRAPEAATLPEASTDNSLQALLITLANEMTPAEQKQLTSLLLREGITGLLQRLGIRRTDMKKLHRKIAPEELAETLGVARQTVNRWVRKNGWKTEGINGVKGGRARLILIDAQVKAHIMNIPAIRKRQALYQLAETAASYGDAKPVAVLPGIINALENMTLAEQERLETLLTREGIQGFLVRLSIHQPAE